MKRIRSVYHFLAGIAESFGLGALAIALYNRIPLGTEEERFRWDALRTEKTVKILTRMRRYEKALRVHLRWMERSDRFPVWNFKDYLILLQLHRSLGNFDDAWLYLDKMAPGNSIEVPAESREFVAKETRFVQRARDLERDMHRYIEQIKRIQAEVPIDDCLPQKKNPLMWFHGFAYFCASMSSNLLKPLPQFVMAHAMMTASNWSWKGVLALVFTSGPIIALNSISSYWLDVSPLRRCVAVAELIGKISPELGLALLEEGRRYQPVLVEDIEQCTHIRMIRLAFNLYDHLEYHEKCLIMSTELASLNSAFMVGTFKSQKKKQE